MNIRKTREQIQSYKTINYGTGNDDNIHGQSKIK